MLREALGIWRGPPLADFAYEPFAQAAIAQLEELHLAAIEDRVEADLALGRARELVGELRDLVARHPLRERLRGQLMLALYRSGQAGRGARGLPGVPAHACPRSWGSSRVPALQQLELAILGRDPALDLATGDRASGGGAEGPGRGWPAQPRRLDRRRLARALGGAVLLASRAGGVVMAAGGGRATQPPVIPGDAVGAISPSGGAIRAVVPLGTLAVGVGGRRRGGVGGQLQRGDGVADRPGHARGGRRRSRSGSTPDRDRGRRRRGVGHQQLRRDGVADRPGGGPGRADDRGRQRADRGGGRRRVGVGGQLERRDAQPDRRGHAAL